MNFLTKIFASLALLLAISNAHAVNKEPYTQARFDALQASGEVVLIDIYAPWCPTCAKQQKVFEQFTAENPDKKWTILVVDFDKDKEAVRQFRAPRQSTLLIYRGKMQHWFSVAETRSEVIFAELNKAINYKYN